MVRSVAALLPPEPGSARRARQELEPFRGLMTETRFGDLRLLVSELVAEASGGFDHSRGDSISVRAECEQGRVRASVQVGARSFHASSTQPEPGKPGWSVYLVQRLGDRWGLKRDGERATVWFEVPTHSGSSSFAPAK